MNKIQLNNKLKRAAVNMLLRDVGYDEIMTPREYEKDPIFRSIYHKTRIPSGFANTDKGYIFKYRDAIKKYEELKSEGALDSKKELYKAIDMKKRPKIKLGSTSTVEKFDYDFPEEQTILPYEYSNPPNEASDPLPPPEVLDEYGLGEDQGNEVLNTLLNLNTVPLSPQSDNFPEDISISDYDFSDEFKPDNSQQNRINQLLTNIELAERLKKRDSFEDPRTEVKELLEQIDLSNKLEKGFEIVNNAGEKIFVDPVRNKKYKQNLARELKNANKLSRGVFSIKMKTILTLLNEIYSSVNGGNLNNKKLADELKLLKNLKKVDYNENELMDLLQEYEINKLLKPTRSKNYMKDIKRIAKLEEKHVANKLKKILKILDEIQGAGYIEDENDFKKKYNDILEVMSKINRNIYGVKGGSKYENQQWADMWRQTLQKMADLGVNFVGSGYKKKTKKGGSTYAGPSNLVKGGLINPYQYYQQLDRLAHEAIEGESKPKRGGASKASKNALALYQEILRDVKRKHPNMDIKKQREMASNQYKRGAGVVGGRKVKRGAGVVGGKKVKRGAGVVGGKKVKRGVVEGRKVKRGAGVMAINKINKIIKDIQNEHPNMSYRDAQKLASAIYKIKNN